MSTPVVESVVSAREWAKRLRRDHLGRRGNAEHVLSQPVMIRAKDDSVHTLPCGVTVLVYQPGSTSADVVVATIYLSEGAELELVNVHRSGAVRRKKRRPRF